MDCAGAAVMLMLNIIVVSSEEVVGSGAKVFVDNYDVLALLAVSEAVYFGSCWLLRLCSIISDGLSVGSTVRCDARSKLGKLIGARSIVIGRRRAVVMTIRFACLTEVR